MMLPGMKKGEILRGDFASSHFALFSSIVDRPPMPVPIANLLSPYLDLVRGENPSAALQFYPGSPLVARRLMRGDPAALSAQIDAEAKVFGERMRSAEAQEAFAAFFEKRPPDFKKVRDKS